MIFDSSLPLFLCWLYSWFLSLFPPQQHQGMVSSPHTVSATPFPPQGEDSSPLPPTGNSPPQRFCFPFLSALSRRQPHCCWWAQPWSRAGAVSIGPRGGSWQLPTESTPEAPQYQTLATKPNPPTLQEVFSPLFWVHLSTYHLHEESGIHGEEWMADSLVQETALCPELLAVFSLIVDWLLKCHEKHHDLFLFTFCLKGLFLWSFHLHGVGAKLWNTELESYQKLHVGTVKNLGIYPFSQYEKIKIPFFFFFFFFHFIPSIHF